MENREILIGFRCIVEEVCINSSELGCLCDTGYLQLILISSDYSHLISEPAFLVKKPVLCLNRIHIQCPGFPVLIN